LCSRETGRYVCAVAPVQEGGGDDRFGHWLGKLHAIKAEIK